MQLQEVESKECYMIRRNEISHWEAASGRYPFLSWGPDRATLWVTSEFDGGELALFVLSAIPYPYGIPEAKFTPQHCLDWELDNIGCSELITGDYKSDSVARWLLENGIAPEQPFRIEFCFSCSKDYYTGEVDTYSDIEIIEIEYWENKEIEDAWVRYLCERS